MSDRKRYPHVIIHPRYKEDKGVPMLKRQDYGEGAIRFIPFSKTRRKEINADNRRKIVHFFEDDDKFFRVFEYPDRYLKRLAQYSAILTPDFSLYPEMNAIQQLYNVFRSRWCGAFWQEHGFLVIPTISWSDENSFNYCFSGIQKGSPVAIATVGNIRNNPNGFMKGYQKMLEVLDPSIVYCYGKPLEGMKDDTVFISYEETTHKGGRK